jgi:DNA-binding CsgD family transcriptional regulator
MIDRISAIQKQVDKLSMKLADMQRDLQFIASVVARKEEKRNRRLKKKEEARLEAEREKQAYQRRKQYEYIIWQIFHQPGALLPAPASGLSAKELELTAVLAKSLSNEEIAELMNLRPSSINARISVINKRLGFKSREGLIAFYNSYRRKLRIHRHNRCAIIMSWLLSPPTGFISRRDFNLPEFQRKLGGGRDFRYVGIHIPFKLFDEYNKIENEILKHISQGHDLATMAQRMKIKESTIKGRLSEIRRLFKWRLGGIPTWEKIGARYKQYLKRRCREKN